MILAEKDIRWGEEIANFRDAEILEHPTSRTLMLSQFEYAYEPNVIARLDHSCDPNTLIDAPRRLLIATQALPKGPPLPRFYPATEWTLVAPFRCFCGAPGCITEVRGAKF